MNTKELLPCPFCGSDALPGHSRERGFYVQCLMQDCEASVDFFTSELIAIDAWNTRAPVAGLTEEWVNTLPPHNPNCQACCQMESALLAALSKKGEQQFSSASPQLQNQHTEDEG